MRLCRAELGRLDASDLGSVLLSRGPRSGPGSRSAAPATPTSIVARAGHRTLVTSTEGSKDEMLTTRQRHVAGDANTPCRRQVG